MQFEIPQIPVAGMRGQDDFFTRGQMCLSLFQIVRPRRRQRRRGERRAIPAHCRSRPRLLAPKWLGLNAPEPWEPSPFAREALCWSRRRHRRAQVWPQLSLAAAPSSNYEGSTGAERTRPASEVRPPPAEPFTPPVLLVLSRAPLGAPLPHTSPSGPHPRSSAPHHPLQRSPAKPRATNENSH